MRPSVGIAILLATSLVGAATGARGETYIALSTGTAKTRSSDIHFRQPSAGTDATFHGVAWQTRPLAPPIYYGIKAGHFLERRPQWGLELELVHNKVFARTERNVPVTGTWNGTPVNETAPMDQRVQRFNITHGVNTLSLSALYRWIRPESPAFPQGRLQPYVGVGSSLYILHAENTVNHQTNREHYSTSGIGWQAFGGVRYTLTPKLGAFAEAKYTRGVARADTADDGRARTRLGTWHGAVGILYAF